MVRLCRAHSDFPAATVGIGEVPVAILKHLGREEIHVVGGGAPSAAQTLTRLGACGADG